jgi:hypothetical protein
MLILKNFLFDNFKFNIYSNGIKKMFYFNENLSKLINNKKLDNKLYEKLIE